MYIVIIILVILKQHDNFLKKYKGLSALYSIWIPIVGYRESYLFLTPFLVLAPNHESRK